MIDLVLIDALIISCDRKLRYIASLQPKKRKSSSILS